MRSRRAEVTEFRWFGDALAFRAQIEQAKGVLMYALECDADFAFAVLLDLARHGGTSVRYAAGGLLDGIAAREPLPSAVYESYRRQRPSD